MQSPEGLGCALHLRGEAARSSSERCECISRAETCGAGRECCWARDWEGQQASLFLLRGKALPPPAAIPARQRPAASIGPSSAPLPPTGQLRQAPSLILRVCPDPAPPGAVLFLVFTTWREEPSCFP